MSSLPDIVIPLIADPCAEPWVWFCAQCVERRKPCVLVTVKEAPAGGPCERGEHFVYDADGHGLLPRDVRFSISLHRLTQEALSSGPISGASVPTLSGQVQVDLVPYLP